MLPRVRLVLCDDRITYAVLLFATSNGRDVEQIALGGGPTPSEALNNARRFVDVLQQAVWQLTPSDVKE